MLVDNPVECSDAFCSLNLRSITMDQVLSLFQLNQARLQNLSDRFPKVVSRLRHKHNLVMFFSFPDLNRFLNYQSVLAE